MSGLKREAVIDLVFYMRQVYKAAGLHWDESNSDEIRKLVEKIICAAVDEVVARLQAPPRPS